MSKLPQKHFQIVFSLIMGAMMSFVMTGVITLVNVGLTPDFFWRWGHAFVVAYAIAVPVVYFVAPQARKIAGRIAQDPLAAQEP